MKTLEENFSPEDLMKIFVEKFFLLKIEWKR